MSSPPTTSKRGKRFRVTNDVRVGTLVGRFCLHTLNVPTHCILATLHKKENNQGWAAQRSYFVFLTLIIPVDSLETGKLV